MTVLATYHIKGGVGKTATAVNISHLAAESGARVLLWDLDPQGAATYYFRIKPKVKGGGEKLLRGKTDLDKVIRGSDFENLDLIPADFSYRNMDLFLDGNRKKKTRKLAEFIEPLRMEYDLIVLDCPPSISVLSENVFYVADVLLVPVIPTTLSVRTLEQLDTFREQNGLDDLKVFPFFSMVDKRKKLHRDVMAELPKNHENVLESWIPNASHVENMGLERRPVADFAPTSAAAEAYRELLVDIVSNALE